MNLIENFYEGIRSIKANRLRAILTATIVSIGITALVGMLTTVDAIEKSVTETLNMLGGNSFDLYSKGFRNRRRRGAQERAHPPLTFKQTKQFVREYDYPANLAAYAYLTIIAEITQGNLKTNPNVNVMGATDEYLLIKGLNLKQGRNFTPFEIEHGNYVAILGATLAKTLFPNNKNPINGVVSFRNTPFKVIAVLKKKGEMSENNYDNMLIIPILNVARFADKKVLNYRITVVPSNDNQMDYAMSEATGIMRKIRHDRIGKENSFDINKSETLAQEMDSIITGLRFGGFGIGFITLLGASIALMNIMLVSVTERTREVGVRKALGATPKLIRQQFIIEAITICLLGGVVGVLLGIAVGNVLSRIMSIEVFVVPWLSMLLGLFVCILVGLLSGYYPANKASRLDPIESLRFE